MDDEMIERHLKMIKEEFKGEGRKLPNEDELRDIVIKSLEIKENELLGKILEAIQETIEQPLSNKKHWKNRTVAGLNRKFVVIQKRRAWLSNTVFPIGKPTLFVAFAIKGGKFFRESWVLDSKFSVVEPWTAAARWLGVDLPPPLHEILGPGVSDIFP